MTVRRGDIVIVDFRRTDSAAKVRPALVVQNDRDNARMRRTIVAQITSNISRTQEDTQYLVDRSHADWATSGLRLPSVVNTCNLVAVGQDQVTHVIGSLSATAMQQVDACLKSALGL
jgi:mRNA interferase MazF